jgi:signal transduction histidine kinase
MGEGVIVTDWSYNIIHANPLAHALLGLDDGSLEGALLFDHVPRSTFSILEEQPIGEKNPTWTVKFHSIKENFPLIASVAVVDEEEEQTLGLIILLRDISSERELDHLRSRFLENISNQIRNPLASLSGFMDLFTEEAEGKVTPRQKEYLDVMTSDVVRLTDIVEDLLSMSRIELSDYNLSPETFPAAEVALSAVASCQGEASRRGIELLTDLPDDLAEVFADRESAVDVTSRLITNAVKYSPPGSEVTVGTRKVTEEASREMVEIYVRDVGPGIAADRREAIFEKYQNHRIFADGKSRSPGLGLPICRTLVEMNGGKIGYSVPAEGGSEFHFTLPVREKVS